MAVSSEAKAHAIELTRAALRGAQGQNGRWTHAANYKEIKDFTKAVAEKLDGMKTTITKDSVEATVSVVKEGLLNGSPQARRWTHPNDTKEVCAMLDDLATCVESL